MNEDPNRTPSEPTEWVRGQNTDMEKVMGRIKKLLALASSSNEGEATQAMNMAQEMLAAYNLEMAQIDALADPTSATDTGKRVKDKYTRSAMYQYQRDLWKALAQANYCWYEAIPVYKVNSKGHTMRSTYHHYLIGREANTIATKMMGDYLEETINRLVPFKPGRDSSKSWISWKEGCTARLVERLNTKLREMMAADQVKKEATESRMSTDTSIALRDVVASENDANYLFVHGKEAYERMLSYRHDQENCVCEFCVKRREYNRRFETETAIEIPVKQETDRQREKREAKEQRASARYWANQDAKERRHWAKKDVGAYMEGQKAGNDIGLDAQIQGVREATRGED